MKKAERNPKKAVSFIKHYEKFMRRSSVAIEGDPVVIEERRDPSPLEFEIFIPWVCRKWSASTSVVVTPKLQEDLHRKPKQNQASKMDVTCHLEESNISESIAFNKLMEDTYLVPVTAYYDTKQHLVEIAIEGSVIRASRKLIAAFGLCAPYHSSLTRFTFRRSLLNAALIYEIHKLLLISTISEIVFDDSYVPEANYYILLEQISQLKYLSLNRCKINDAVCKKIFENIQLTASAANSLKILELGSNNITDDAATFIASVLRVNRSLLHLNLSGNKITDSGFVPILDSLMEFPLNFKERYDSRSRKIKYLQSKAAVYERCLNSLKGKNTDDYDSTTSYFDKSLPGVALSKSSKMVLKRVRSKAKRSIHNLEAEAEMMTKGIMGEFHDPFSPDDVVVKNEAAYCKGNFVLCYINIAYNNLENFSIQRLHDVLVYQDGMCLQSQSGKGITGLIKITLDGNHIPTTCSPLLQEIDLYLKKVIFLKTTGNKKIALKKHSTTFLKK